MSVEDKSNLSDNDWVITETNLNSNPSSITNSQIDSSTLVKEFDEEPIPNSSLLIENLSDLKTSSLDESILSSKLKHQSLIETRQYNKLKQDISNMSSNSNITLSAETLRILSAINIDNLSFNSKFDLLFNDISMLKASAVQGILAKTNFRFLAWMIFLDCIPMEKSKWIESIYRNRSTYEKIKKELCCDPHLVENNDSNTNLIQNFDHPLSNSNNSTWNKYFSENEKKFVIIQDVIRINQQHELFALRSIQDAIVNLLFIYVQFTKTEYRQGMHEILASILYVIHEEYLNLSKATDSNTIFQAVMETMHDWYGTSVKTNDRSFNRRLSCPTLNGINLLTTSPKLFQNDEQFYESKIINKINHIANVVLKNNDIEIYNHLNAIEVSLCPFGIRWLRLLFTRELHFPSCLILWDAIFATDCHEFSLVNYLFVALLSYLREDLLRMDNSSCLRLLMQPHFHLEPLEVLKTALYLQNPAVYSRPLSMENSYEIINNTFNKNPHSPQKFAHNHMHPNHFNSKNTNYQHNISRNIASNPKLNSASLNDKDKDRNNNENSNILNVKNRNINKIEFDPVKISNKLDMNLRSYDSINTKKENEMKLFSMRHMHHNVDLVTHNYINKISELQNENQILKSRLNDLEDLCNRSSLKLNANITLLQEEIMKSNELRDDDTTLLALAGLKQVRDQLNPSFIYEEEEILSNNLAKEKKIKYRKNQQHQIIQTCLESSSTSSNSSTDLVNEKENDNQKKTNNKRRFSLFLKKSSELNENDNLVNKNETIRGRLRSFSLLNSSNVTDFLSSSFMNSGINTKQNSKTNKQTDDSSSLDDDVDVNIKNLKLVLNNNDEKDDLTTKIETS